ncbi:glycerophosphodiester phosphodiesterase family protein [Mongoliitalea daihaiensis]|uniref:glycerophosphodiester phosphodiesterase family protein n=1 Tax=Mongoliitalea daihaiensis TaxID=2782006 RepID=UPI001F1F0414|nr:glycerophosphodiester phosphodiesterase family protein [Mongoliitalea daihaiensis]UJP66423.1 glycerophosphodiester phosphodiesterase family protein [Mongoliitalea daihaiensis]
MNKLLIIGFFLLVSCKEAAVTQAQEAWGGERLKTIVLTNLQETEDFYTWSSDRIPMVSAHRGGPYPGFPENSLEAFENTLKHTPSIIEFDVALTKDSVLVLMHDNTLDRTTTGKGRVIDHTYEEIQDLFLVDKEGTVTDFKVPTLEEVLAWGKGKSLFTVDIKREVPFEMIVDAIKRHEAEPYAAVITYSLEAAQQIHRLHSDLMLSVSIRNEEELARFQASGIPVNRWIAFTGTSERSAAFNQQLHELGVFTILGTLGNLDRSAIARGDQLYVGFVQNGADILATDRPIEAAKAIEGLIPMQSLKGKYFGQ